MIKLMDDLKDQGVPIPDLAFLRARIKSIKSTYKTELLKVCESKKLEKARTIYMYQSCIGSQQLTVS
jgi:hypothetical protein